mmetsp:Transcript_10946/g.22316  ORF Transcript_10946/g.22316 Transcript_10946/m.22316 type:complete len:276 (-) Transcript_10946:38-865(-)
MASETKPASSADGADPDGAGIDGADRSNAGSTLSIGALLKQNSPPDELPPGWVMRRSRHHSSACYYYNQDSGISKWDPPRPDAKAAPQPASTTESGISVNAGDGAASASSTTTGSTGRSILKRAAENEQAPRNSEDSPAEDGRPSPPQKKQNSSRKPEQVRVMHILKKHKDSRRPASWRNPNITDSKDKATKDLKEIIAILKETESDPKELRGTFEELAKDESDCSSAKRGGDLGYFGRKKMQPAFEKASFGLKVGELSGIVETSSGVHVILRLC